MLRRISLAFLVALFAVACDENPTQPNAIDQLRELPSLSFINGPATPGESPIERGDAPYCYWCATLDAESNLHRPEGRVQVAGQEDAQKKAFVKAGRSEGIKPPQKSFE